MSNMFTQIFLEMVERNIPSKLVTIRLTDKPCFISVIKKEM